MLNITISNIRLIPQNPNMPDWKDAKHYQVQLKGANGKRFSLAYSKGYGLKERPSVDEVVEAILREVPMYYMGLTELMTYACIDHERDAKRVMREVTKSVEGLAKITDLSAYDLLALSEDLD
jgi:hypothetical protein